LSKKTAAELKAENRLLLRGHISVAISSVVNTAIPWIAAVLLARYAYMSIDALAGQKTTADIGIKFLGDLKVSQSLFYLFGAGGIAYGLNQRKLRKKTIEHISERVQRHEREIDPKRSSSKLTKRGETRPEDK
jgi:hypothetical protein